VIGGKDANRDAVEIVEKYSPLSDTWSAVTSLPEPRSHHTAVTVGSDLYVLGGKLDGMATSSTLKFDSTQGVWNEVTSMPARRSAFAACAVGSDIYVFGGSCGPANVQPSVFKYDTVANVWDTLAPMPHSYFNNSASVLDGLVYIVGGGGTGQEVLRFDPASGVWRALARTKMSHFEGKSFVMDSYLFAVGGDTAGNMLMERYDQVANTWEYADSLIEGRSLCGAVTIAPTGRQAEKMDLLDTLIAKATQ
jgi:N-acetylneuraminic acid mutarotase